MYQRYYDRHIEKDDEELAETFSNSQKSPSVHLGFVFLRNCSEDFPENCISCIDNWVNEV